VVVEPLKGVKATLTEDISVTVTVVMVGAIVKVFLDDDGFDAVEVPNELVAVTVNVYAVFVVNPNTVIGDVEPVPVKFPGLLFTV
jgi:hypothetical protein